MAARIEIKIGDITEEHVEAIVNAANVTLRGGGGVDGAIHRRAGGGLLQECISLGGAEVGEARITKGYHLPAKFVIHTVGPVWQGGSEGEDELLARCYINALKRAEENNIATIAFPAISTGAYRFPLERAARIAFTSVRNFLSGDHSIQKVVFVCFNKQSFDIYTQTAGEQ
jgi:O-acetyl-ADP-ribose deacetylase